MSLAKWESGKYYKENDFNKIDSNLIQKEAVSKVNEAAFFIYMSLNEFGQIKDLD